MRNGIAISIEGINTGLIGAYGSNTAVTPTIDFLAAHGIVLDQCFVDSMDRKRQMASLWTGSHAWGDVQTGQDSLWDILQAAGYDVCLVSDCPVIAELAEHLGCPRVILIEVESHDEPVDHWTESTVAEVFVAAIEELDGESTKRFVWVHSRGLRHAWDAPADLRARFVDPEDPDPPAECMVPRICITDDTDPDEIIGWGQVAAAQLAIVDQAIDTLRQAVSERSDADQWSWFVVSPGGVPLGEHGYVGWHETQLHGEEINCLVLMTHNLSCPIGQRRPELCQLPDLYPSLIDLLEIEPPATLRCWGKSLLRLVIDTTPIQWPSAFQVAYISHDNQQRWIRTPAWSGILDEQTERLYVKPDDRWEVSDIASRRPDVVERLAEIEAIFQKSVINNDRDQMPALEEELCNLLR
jgi:arylsulfatase A-like enzyme